MSYIVGKNKVFFVSILNLLILIYGCRDASEILLNNPLTTEECWRELHVKDRFSIVTYKLTPSIITMVANFDRYDILLIVDNEHYDLWDKRESEMKRVQQGDNCKWNILVNDFKNRNSLYQNIEMPPQRLFMFNYKLLRRNYPWCNGPFFAWNGKFVDYTTYKSFHTTFLNPLISYIYFGTDDVNDFFEKIEDLQKKVKKEYTPNGGYYYKIP